MDLHQPGTPGTRTLSNEGTATFPAGPVLSVRGLSKTYAGGHRALDEVDLEMCRGEIFALLGPNGAGKTTLISIVCGLVQPGQGQVQVAGFDIGPDYRETRSRVGLVPQELHTDTFETVIDTVRFSRGLFGCEPDDRFLEQLLRDLSLWEKRDQRIMTLSGGMKRRVLIAKALSHEPELLFLDEPTAGVDVELRRDMWALVHRLRERGVSILLTTHYIEEAEEMADRIGVIHQGRLILVDDKAALIRKLGRKQLTLHLDSPLPALPPELEHWGLDLAEQGEVIEYHFDANDEQARVPQLLRELARAGVEFTDLNTRQSSLEEIFIRLLEENR
ncbi:ABC transporter ATP-binding protein [Wenzhouxiangella sp. AB-CW3]|uniref:ABC transporter ATP-binding protein n=1 Tax=Wenzhouxiangella sp. AB-CW3 TaxID=2771012 RepID=UPI00168A4F35|nr:ABC transporter ATP-binding protein [Wenzhouxiangella sp. AB-CW3]QOC23155.1 ABC transporter ATP-binding protein [Wenzhouxiangella sp. AB-CW3]